MNSKKSALKNRQEEQHGEPTGEKSDKDDEPTSLDTSTTTVGERTATRSRRRKYIVELFGVTTFHYP